MTTPTGPEETTLCPACFGPGSVDPSHPAARADGSCLVCKGAGVVTTRAFLRRDFTPEQLARLDAVSRVVATACACLRLTARMCADRRYGFGAGVDEPCECPCHDGEHNAEDDE